MGVVLKRSALASTKVNNKLNILSADLQSLNVKNFFAYSPFQKSDFSNIPALRHSGPDARSINLKDLKDLKAGIMQVVRDIDLAIELHQNNTEKAAQWFQSPNSFLFGDSPFEVCIRGDGAALIEWILESVEKSDTGFRGCKKHL